MLGNKLANYPLVAQSPKNNNNPIQFKVKGQLPPRQQRENHLIHKQIKNNIIIDNKCRNGSYDQKGLPPKQKISLRRKTPEKQKL